MAEHRSDDFEREDHRREDARTIREVLVVLGVVAVACFVIFAITQGQTIKVLSVMSGSV
jgi:hypothetical protein